MSLLHFRFLDHINKHGGRAITGNVRLSNNRGEKTVSSLVASIYYGTHHWFLQHVHLPHAALSQLEKRLSRKVNRMGFLPGSQGRHGTTCIQCPCLWQVDY